MLGSQPPFGQINTCENIKLRLRAVNILHVEPVDPGPGPVQRKYTHQQQQMRMKSNNLWEQNLKTKNLCERMAGCSISVTDLGFPKRNPKDGSTGPNYYFGNLSQRKLHEIH